MTLIIEVPDNTYNGIINAEKPKELMSQILWTLFRSGTPFEALEDKVDEIRDKVYDSCYRIETEQETLTVVDADMVADMIDGILEYKS